MNFENATKNQLLQIALYEDCPLDYKYQAIKELQYRHIPEDIQADIMYQFGVGKSAEEIAEENGLSVFEIASFIRQKYQRGKKKSDENWKIGYKKTIQTAGMRLWGRKEA